MPNTRARPVSPHLQIYRPQLTSVLSVLHRLSGLLLSVCSVVLSFVADQSGAGRGGIHSIHALRARMVRAQFPGAAGFLPLLPFV